MNTGDKITLDDLKTGDVICSLRGAGLYKHYGVWLGGGRVIDFSSETRKDAREARIREVDLERFSLGQQLQFDSHGNGTADEIRRRAAEVSGRIQYNLITSNCEHVARYVASGLPEKWRSTQVAVVVFTTIVAFGIYFLLTSRKA